MKKLAAGVLLAGILLTGCSPAPAAEDSMPSAGSTPRDTAETPHTAETPAPPGSAAVPDPTHDAPASDTAERLAPLIGATAGRPAHVVLLGDSFAAGEGAGSYEPVNGVAESRCHRSTESLAAAAQGNRTGGAANLGRTGRTGSSAADGSGIVVHNFACSRARISALETAQQVEGHGSGGVPAQLEQMAGVRPDLVLLYIGGNDLGFADLLQACVAETEPCGQDPALREATGQRLLELRPELEDMYRKLGAAARSPVLVLPYPRMFDLGAEDCGRLTSGELAFGLEITDALNGAIEQSVLGAGLPNVRYVDALEDSFAQRGACSPDPLVKTVRIGPLLGAASSAAASQEILHPTAEGYRALTADLLQWLEDHPA